MQHFSYHGFSTKELRYYKCMPLENRPPEGPWTSAVMKAHPEMKCEIRGGKYILDISVHRTFSRECLGFIDKSQK